MSFGYGRFLENILRIFLSVKSVHQGGTDNFLHSKSLFLELCYQFDRLHPPRQRGRRHWRPADGQLAASRTASRGNNYTTALVLTYIV